MLHRRLAHGFSVLLLAACGSDSDTLFEPCTGPDCDGDPCDGVVCDSPPAASCADDGTLRVFSSPGTCSEGACAYASQDTACSMGCQDGACAGDPCAGVTCDSPPGPCHEPAGTCQNGVCSYAVAVGDSCDDADPCTSDDVCDASGACAGSALDCQSPPAPACKDENTLTVYDWTGVCDGAGQCTYGSTEVPCAEGCENGACAGDPCAGVICDAPPTACHQATGTCESGVCLYEFDNGANCDDGDACTELDVCQGGVCAGTAKACTTPDSPVCADTDTLRVWASPGQCGGAGQCSYVPTDVPCEFGCDNGACVGDPCAGITCDDPPPASCVNGKDLLTPATQGSCYGGACNYVATVSTCTYGCAQGACQAPTGLVISELLYDSDGYPDTESFLELHGPPGLSVDGLRVVGVNGNGGNDYTSVVLSGNLDSNGLYVISHPSASGAQAANLTSTVVDFQNGPDSVQLRFGTSVLDAVAYGTFGVNDVAAGEGTPVAGHALGESLHRDETYTDTNDNATDFASHAPTPGAPHVDTSCDTVLNPGCDCINGSTQPCGTDVGACEFGSQTCVQGAWAVCTGGVSPKPEVCGNPIDENCDGHVDEGCGPEDVFALGTCDGTAMTSAEALALLGSGTRVVLTSATIQRRMRSCGTCAWGDPADWIIHYLTWSGGVTTRYKDLPATMNLVLFNDGGTPRFSIQHTTFAGSTYDDYDGMLYGLPPAVIPYAHVRAYNHFPEQQYDYRELDYMVKDATVVVGDHCLQWVADPYGVGGPPYTTGYGVIFRWN